MDNKCVKKASISKTTKKRTPISSVKQICRYCKFYKPGTVAYTGQCHFQAFPGKDALWPWVGVEDWCSHFEQIRKT